MKIPKVWEILKKFMDSCKFSDWQISESEEWIKIGDEYHNFLYVRDIHPSSFKRIISNRKCVVRKGLSYSVVDASYTAWLLSEPPAENLIETIFENPKFFRRTAIYDLSPLLEGKNVCARLNHTQSRVFKEFENFLKRELKVKLSPLSNPKTKSTKYTVAKIA
ncbi:MAG: hypothetical protein QXZ25_02950 [Candidatus Bathyarchaeia archaeon]